MVIFIIILGKEKYPDGSYYEGSFVKGKKSGKGKIILSNGSTYEGDFNDDKIDGKVCFFLKQGIFQWSDNKKYEGEWKDNCISGFGNFTKARKLYRGYFFNDKKHGFGINYYLDSDAFMIGFWINDCIEGLAICNSPEKGEEIWIMKKNKVIKIITDEEDIKQIKSSEEYNRLVDFYTNKRL